MAILCAATADHATGRGAFPHASMSFVEKPFAASVTEARRMIAAMAGTGKTVAINWRALASKAMSTREAADPTRG